MLGGDQVLGLCSFQCGADTGGQACRNADTHRGPATQGHRPNHAEDEPDHNSQDYFSHVFLPFGEKEFSHHYWRNLRAHLQIKTSANRLSAGAIAANHGLAESENKSATSIQGSPNGSRNTPDKGSRSCPNQPNVPVKNATNANRYMTANTMMVVLQTKSSLS